MDLRRRSHLDSLFLGMTNFDWTIDWTPVAAALRPEPPDAYHSRYEAGATEHNVEFGNCHGPAGNETLWATYDAYCHLYAHSSDRYAAGTVILSLARGIQVIAGKILETRGGQCREMYGTGQVDTVGSDLFAVGLVAALETLPRLPDISDLGDEDDDLDAVEQNKRYIFRAARNRMLNYLRDLYPKWWRKAVRGESSKCNDTRGDDNRPKDEIENVSRRHPVAKSALAVKSSDEKADEAASHRATAAVHAACTCDTDKRIVELRESGHSQQEIAEIMGLSRDQVQRALDRILRTAEELLGLPHATTKKRKSRKKSNDSADKGDRATD